GLALECVQGFPPAGRDQGIVPADPLQIVGVLLRHGGHVVDHEHGGHSPSPGSSTMNLLPAPGAVSTRMAPSASSTRRRTIERPRPVERESTRLNSSNVAITYARFSLQPMSATVIRTAPASPS